MVHAPVGWLFYWLLQLECMEGLCGLSGVRAPRRRRDLSVASVWACRAGHRGRDGGFVVYRLREKHREHVPKMLACCEKYLGRPYDYRYQLDDESIYCSELIYKSFRDATNGQQLGELRKFGEMNWGPYETLIRQIEGGTVPINRKMITPRDLARAKQLEPVFSHRLSIELPIELPIEKAGEKVTP